MEDQGSSSIIETFSYDKLFAASVKLPQYTDYVNYHVCRILPPDLSSQPKKKFLNKVRHYLWDDLVLFKQCANQVISRCVPEEKISSIMFDYYSTPVGGHFGVVRTTAKILESGFYWPKLHLDCQEFIKRCDRC